MYLIWTDFDNIRWVNWTELRDLVVEELKNTAYNTENIKELQETIDLLCDAAMDKKLTDRLDVANVARRYNYRVVDVWDTALNIDLIYKALALKVNKEDLKILSDASDMLYNREQFIKWKKLYDKESD